VKRSRLTDVVYLDYAATTPADREVVEEMLPYFSEAFGNPSSTHGLGQQAKQALEEARSRIAIKGMALASRRRGEHIIISSIEHHSVLDPCIFLEEHGFHVTRLPVDHYGLTDPDEVRRAVTDRTILISVMHANNEIGTIEPVAEISRVARDRGIYFHTDAVQTLGHIPVNVDELGIDALSASAHKLYGPKGIGILYIRKGVDISLCPWGRAGGPLPGRHRKSARDRRFWKGRRSGRPRGREREARYCQAQ
jgi:cysteine desulfurase